MEPRLLIFAALVVAAIATKLFSPRAYVICKPLPIIFILLLAFLKTAQPSGIWYAALLAGLAGDLWLLSQRGFIPGLLSFLLGHVLYIFAFFRSSGGMQPGITAIVGVVSVSTGAFLFLAQRLLRGRNGKYVLPVFLYIVVTALMMLAALSSPGAITGVFGTFFFALSDFLLTFDKFVRPSWYVRAAVSVTYYTAQWLLALHFAAL